MATEILAYMDKYGVAAFRDLILRAQNHAALGMYGNMSTLELFGLAKQLGWVR